MNNYIVTNDLLAIDYTYNHHNQLTLKSDLNNSNNIVNEQTKLKNNKFSILHLNINHLTSKKHELIKIVSSGEHDIILLNETKTTSMNPDIFSEYTAYQSLRRDRQNENIGGGVLALIRKEYKILKTTNLTEIEAIFFQIKVSDQIFNIISCYKPPDEDDHHFLNEIDDFIFNLDPNENLLIIGDLNMNMLEGCNLNHNLLNYLVNNNLSQQINQPTRICTKYYEKTNQLKCSESILDVVINNNDFISETHVLDCPFSDHKFVQINLKIETKKKLENQFIIGRNYSIKNIDEITRRINELDLNLVTVNSSNADERWNKMREEVLNIINEIAPKKEIRISTNKSIPWLDVELSEAKSRRDKAHKIYLKSKREKKPTELQDFLTFDEFKKEHNQLVKTKMIKYFKDTSPKDFKNSKIFWEFYSNTIKLNSSKSTNNAPTTIINDTQTGTNPEEISEMFSLFFTSLTSESTIDRLESKVFIEKTFDEINEKRVKSNLKALNCEKFEFLPVNPDQVQQLIDNLSETSGPGITGISSKIIKAASAKLVPFITQLFNDCIENNIVPTEWKTAVVTPIYKKKGNQNDINNYRGISVLPPLAKIFEKILAAQIIDHLNRNNLLFNGQHGFRADHSCETALHELISDMNLIRSVREVGLFFFIDFKKAFDLVDPDLLLTKLKQYGFSERSILLVADYFKNRNQKVKFDNIYSTIREIILSVPQGSVLGPLFFLLFINDLPYCIGKLKCKLFADDSTLYDSHTNLDTLLSSFNHNICSLGHWCTHNKLDINWTKTYIMFITNKRISLPQELIVLGKKIKVIESFKLLGITFDNKLNFNNYVTQTRNIINRKLHSIKNIFYLPSAVKLQFFKSFIMPYYDYCSTLFIYFSKIAIQRLANSYTLCINKLLGLKQTVIRSEDFNKLNNLLESYGLSNFQHRVILRMLVFTQTLLKAKENLSGPINLTKQLIRNNELCKGYELRNIHEISTSQISNLNSFGENTFNFIYCRLANKFCIHETDISINFYKTRVKNNINIIFTEFVKCWPKLDLNYKYPYKKPQTATTNSNSFILTESSVRCIS